MSAKENQDVSIYAGDTRSLRFPIEGETAGEPATLSAPNGTWKTSTGLSEAERSNPILEKDPTLTQETIGADQWWVAYVDLAEADTIDAPGVYYHQLRIIDGTGKIVTASGKFVVKPLIGV
jgi:hypothetical protein